MTRQLSSPIRVFGGKHYLVSKIVPILEAMPYRVYCEPFGGGASILIAKKQAEVEVYNDINADLAAFFQVLGDDAEFQKFFRRVSVLPFSRSLFLAAGRDPDEPQPTLERAIRTFIVSRMGFSGYTGRPGTNWALVVSHSRRGMASNCSRWLSALNALPVVHDRLRDVIVRS